MMKSVVSTEMTAYDRKVWTGLGDQLLAKRERRIKVPQRVKEASKKVAGRTGQAWESLPGHAKLAEQLQQALEGFRVVTLDPALASVRVSRVLHAYEKAYEVSLLDLSDIRNLSLEQCDETVPNLKLIYSVGTGLEGAGASLAITGAEVATSVSGGTTAAVAIGAMAADTAFVLAALARVVAHTAAYYGYDVRQPEEELFALGVISLSTASSSAAKVAALGELSRLTQQMMRHATWEMLSKEPLVKVIQHVYARLGLRITQKKLAQTVPIAGAVISAGMNMAALQVVAADAKLAYRMRFLCDKYELDPDQLMEDARGRLGRGPSCEDSRSDLIALT